MEVSITNAYLAKHLSEVLDRVHNAGEEFIIERDGENIARLGPARTQPGITWREFVARLADMPMPDDKFADDVEAMRATLSPVEPPEWPC